MVICDTMIWYGLGDRGIKRESFDGEQLACTQITLFELAKTHNLYKNQDSVRKAFRAIREFGSAIILEDPYTYALTKFIYGYQYNRQKWMNLLDELKWLLHFRSVIPPENMQKVIDVFDNYAKGFENAIDELNKDALPVKQFIRDNKLKKIVRSTDYTHKYRKYLAGMLIQYHQENENGRIPVGISLNSTVWSDIELISEVWMDFFKELDVDLNRKISYNDWHDIINMMYVGKGDLYWTRETKWINFIDRNENARKYLFRPKLT